MIRVRTLITLALTLVAFVALALLLVITDTALSVWHRLSGLPPWAQIVYAAVLTTAALGAVALAWRWLRPGSRKPIRQAGQSPVSEEKLERELAASLQEGVDVDAALAEWREQRRRKSAGEIHLAVYGEVSAGKSSLVQALVPGTQTAPDARAGSTREIRQYRWRSGQGDAVIVSDLPGFNLGADDALLAEARRAHLVIFVCEGDLTRSQHEQFKRLADLGKPMVIALNKADRYRVEEISAIRERMIATTGLESNDVCPISSGGREQVVEVDAAGVETPAERLRPPRVEGLRATVQRHLDNDRELLERLRDDAVLLMASERLQDAQRAHRDSRAGELVQTYSRRAVVGALAAVAPGSDLVIQGVLATRLVNELCALYAVPVREVQVEEFLKLAGGRLRKLSALTMAIAGNALKAFPGLGTITGGLLHAAAYGMIFDSLGRAAAATLASRGELRPLPAALAFEDELSENLETRAGRFAKMAITATRKVDSS